MKLLFENWRKYITEDWRDTSWKDDDEIVTIGEVDDYLGDKMIDVTPLEVRNQVLKNRGKDRLPTTSQDRIDNAKFGEYKKDDMGEKIWVHFPIIATMKGGEFIEVLDGNHRLQKAIDQGVENIKAKILDLTADETPAKFKRMFGGAG